MILRDYQGIAEANIFTELSQHQSTLLVMATGCGKTVVFGNVSGKWNTGRVLVLAHREELIFQAANKIEKITGERPDIEMADFYAAKDGLLSASNVVVSSVQTQNSGRRCRACGKATKDDGDEWDTNTEPEDPSFPDAEPCKLCIDGIVRRMQRFDPDEFSLIIIDEAHHATANSYKRILDYYKRNPNVKILGVTATPDRTDEEALGKVFDSVAFEYGILDGIKDGYLVRILQQMITVKGLDLSQCRTTAGDLNEGDLERIMLEEEPLHEVVSATISEAGEKPTLVFAASVAHAEGMAAIFNRHKPNSALCIHGKTPKEDRRRDLDRYARGEFQYLCGCGVFLEGFDEPRIQCIAMARPTKSRSLYAQAIGRGTRPIFGDFSQYQTPEERCAAIAASVKPNVLILDFVGNSGRHKLINTSDILGGNFDDKIIEKAVASAKKKGKPVDMLEEFAEVEAAWHSEKRKAVKAQASYSKKSIDPFDVFEITPRREPGWFKGKPLTPKMNSMLENAGIDTKHLTFAQGKQLIGEICARREKNLCSYKQAKTLAKYGERTDVGFKEASALIDAIAKNGWKPLPPKPGANPGQDQPPF